MSYYQKNSTSKKKKAYAAVIFVVVAILIIVAAYLWSTRPNTGTISTVLPKKQQPSVTYENLNGKYIAFTYNGAYTVKALPPSGSDLEMYILTADSFYNKQLAVDVSELPAGNLNNNSSFNYRKTAPTLYSSQSVKVDGLSSIEWLKVDGSEITVQIPRGDMVATLSFTTGSTADHLQPEVDSVMNSFRWK